MTVIDKMRKLCRDPEDPAFVTAAHALMLLLLDVAEAADIYMNTSRWPNAELAQNLMRKLLELEAAHVD